MPDPETVKRVLAELAHRPTDAGARMVARFGADSPDDYRAVIDQACAAVQDLSAAAEFVDAVGTGRLESAIQAAEAAGDHAAARRGERALTAFERLRSAGT